MRYEAQQENADLPRYVLEALKPRERFEKKPDWFRVRFPSGENYLRLRALFRELDLHTVCEEASCPNVAECWGGGTATIMLMGDACTRGCRFCHVITGNPHGTLDPMEPERVAKAVRSLGLRYIVLTSVCRDDLPDGGADHFARTVEAIKAEIPSLLVEVLVPDFGGNKDSLRRVVDSGPDVIAHNIETVEWLTPLVRDRRASYRQSLMVLEWVKRMDPRTYTKSSIMLGLGELEEEVVQSMRELREARVDILTLGQYLQPSLGHLRVERYVPPEQFARLRGVGESLGFLYVASGPLVRSSYRAAEHFLAGVAADDRK